MTISPASMLASSQKKVEPVSVWPVRIVHGITALPRSFGKAEGWKPIAPSRQTLRNFTPQICDQPTTSKRSGSIPERKCSVSSLLTSLVWWMPM